MIIPGSACKNKVSSEEIAKKQLNVLKKNVPSDVTGLLFYLEDKASMKLQKI